MGFTQVYDYTAGKLDWLAAGLATEGSNTMHPRAGEVARKDVPTCALEERLGEVARRVRAAGWDACVVVNAERVVFGLLRAKELQADPELRVEQAMRPGPSTFRPFVSIVEMARFMADHDWRARRSPPLMAGWSGCCTAATRPGPPTSFARAKGTARKGGRHD
jgi:CBS domain-containing protein